MPASFQYVLTLIRDPRCIYVHFAPPCGTSSRARFIQRKGRYNPPIVRTDAYPDGLPDLPAELKLRVDTANHLYDLTQQLCRECHKTGVLFSIENPARSFMWDTKHFKQFLAEIPHFQTRFHHCQFGSSRRKFTLLIHNIACLQTLECRCDDSHPHESWGQTSSGWATSLETAYPWALCRAIATQVALQLQNLGVSCKTPRFAEQALHLEQIRHDTWSQSSSKALPMVSEFQKVIHLPVDQPLPPLSRLLSTPSLGEIASEGFKTVGVHRSPADFVKEALEVKHPAATVSQLPGPMLAAVHRAATETVESLCRTRSETLRMMLSKAKEFQPAEEELKRSLSARRREVLKGKRLVLFRWLLEQSGSTDTKLVTDLCEGFDLTGALPESNTFSKRFRPAQLPTDTLRGVAEKARTALLSNIRSSGDAELDRGVYEATQKECRKGFLVGPVSPDELPKGATLTRRFGVAQKDKIRPIDDYRASMVNSSVTQAEAVSIHGVDHIAAMCAEYLRCSSSSCSSGVELVAKCWDLASAYKQVPLSDSAFHLDSYLVVYNPHTDAPEVYQQKVLPFGSIASVTAFLRCALALWHIGSVMLWFTWTSYFDDFLSICDVRASRHTEMCTSLFFQMLGWKLSEDKLVPYETCCKVLGIDLDLSKTPEGVVALANTVSRRAELLEFIDHILATRKLSKCDAERFRGRLQFAWLLLLADDTFSPLY